MDFPSVNSRFAVQNDGAYLRRKTRGTCASNFILYALCPTPKSSVYLGNTASVSIKG